VSTTSPQAQAAGEQSVWQAQLSQMLSGVALPELTQLMGQNGLGGMLSGRDASGRLPQDAANLAGATSQLNQSYGQAKMGSREAIAYGGLRSGEGRMSPGATGSATMSAATSLDRDRQSALRNLEFQSASSSMSDYNQVLQLLGQGTKSGLGLAQGFSGAAGSAIGGMSGQSQFGSALGGAASGAALGSSISPGWGTVIGGVVGGVAGGLGGG
jgi:hypothetical protein